MIWFALQILAVSILRWQEPQGSHELDLIYSAALLIFCLWWPGRDHAPEWRTLGSLGFTSLQTFTALMVLVHGPMGSLAIVWPALMSRLEPHRDLQRVLLIGCQWLLAAVRFDDPWLFSLNVGLVVASLIQLNASRLTRWFALGAMALALGPLSIALCMSDPPEAIIKTILLLTLPQLGLLALSRPRGPVWC